VGVVNARFIKPMDIALLKALLRQGVSRFVTVEENVLIGGFGAGILEVFQELGVQVPVLRLGLPDYFIEHGAREILLRQIGLDVESMTERLRDFLRGRVHAV